MTIISRDSSEKIRNTLIPYSDKSHGILKLVIEKDTVTFDLSWTFGALLLFDGIVIFEKSENHCVNVMSIRLNHVIVYERSRFTP